MESIAQTNKNLAALNICAMFDRRISKLKVDSSLPFYYPYRMLCDNLTFNVAFVVPVFCRCDVCYNIHAITETIRINGDTVCDDCIKTYYRRCEYCGKYTVFEDIQGEKTMVYSVKYENRHMFVCHNCFEIYFISCDICHEIHLTSFSKIRNLSNGNSVYLCPRCVVSFDKENKRCIRCGNCVKISEIRDNLCVDCYIDKNNTKEKKEIHPYGRTEGTVFLTTKDSGDCLGLELEVSDGNETDRLLQELSEFPEIVLKRDGSIRNGFEIVSYPLSLDYHKNMMKWKKIFSILEKYGYKSNDSNTSCGYHVHMSRLSFGDTVRKQSKNNAYLLYLIESNQTYMKKFSRRNDFEYCNFYNIDYSWIPVTRAYQKAVNKNHTHRNMVMNYQNDKTVECRLFRGTLNYTSFIAVMELLDHLKNIAVSCKNESELKTYSWEKIMESIPVNFTALKSYCDKKGLLRV